MIPLLQAYGKYMYGELYLTAGKETFEREMLNFPIQKYSPSSGVFLIAYLNNKPAGIVGLKKWDEKSCEMKRLYVLPELRGMGLGKTLNNAIIEEARKYGYQQILLDTNAEMEEAVYLYIKLGFIEIPAYVANENHNVIF